MRSCPGKINELRYIRLRQVPKRLKARKSWFSFEEAQSKSSKTDENVFLWLLAKIKKFEIAEKARN